MPIHSVKLHLIPNLSIECKFWLEDDGWNGTAEQLSISVRASSFHDAKSELESALGKHLDNVLRERTKAQTHAA
jgi:hypothetical protein